ncbi:MAG TPA: hypothetical protein VJ722_04380 [Rhodanobacteraceae bacterium]|nr:hypothetical protein [Rhodanobacteraceae bacterium]
MHRHLFLPLALLSAAGVMFAKPSCAVGTSADDLGRCLIRSTTPADRRVLTQWAFATLALDPDVAPLASISPAQGESINRRAGGVVTAMLADSCPAQARRAFANGGPEAIQAAFETWGQWAITGLVSEPHVMQGMAGLLEYIDIGKLMMLAPMG